MRVLVAVGSMALAGCGLTPTQQKIAGIATGLLIVGAIAAHSQDSGKPQLPNVPTPRVDCSMNPQLCR